MSRDPAAQPAAQPAPAPLLVAAALTLVQGLLVLGGAVVELASIDGERLAVGVTTTLFFALVGLVLIGCAWGLRRVSPWARGPVLLVQLVWLGLAWNLRDYPVVAGGLLLAGGLVLFGLLHPRSMAAIEAARGDDED